MARRTNRSTRRSNIPSNRSTMSQSRRDKLLSIQKREKLKALLVRKFRMQYGTSKQMDKVILKAIDGFVKRQRVTEVDLDNLGKTIAAAAKQLGKTPINASTNNNNNIHGGRMGGSLSTKNMVVESSRAGDGGPQISSINASASAPALFNNTQLSSSRRTSNKTPNSSNKKQLAPLVRTPQRQPVEEVPEDWSLIFRYQQKKQAEEARQEKLEKRSHRGNTLASLKALTDAKHKRQEQAKILDQEYSQSVQENMKKWKVEEEEKKAARALVIKKQSIQRQKQMEDRKKRQSLEKKKKLKYEMNLMRRLNRETEQQIERERLKKIEDKKRLVVFLGKCRRQN